MREPFAIEVGHTSSFEPALLDRARRLLDVVFADDPLDAHDWEHALGGVHAIGFLGDRLVGHVSVIQRRLVHGGRALRTGYVEGFGVHPDHQRQGLGSRLMAELERVIAGAYDLGALGATDAAMPLYERRGWRRWEGRTSALTPGGVQPTPDCDGWVYVLPLACPLDLAGELTCDWREGEVW